MNECFTRKYARYLVHDCLNDDRKQLYSNFKLRENLCKYRRTIKMNI